MVPSTEPMISNTRSSPNYVIIILNFEKCKEVIALWLLLNYYYGTDLTVFIYHVSIAELNGLRTYRLNIKYATLVRFKTSKTPNQSKYYIGISKWNGMNEELFSHKHLGNGHKCAPASLRNGPWQPASMICKTNVCALFYN